MLLDHLNLTVRSFEETADWYGRVFGFEVVERGVYNGAPWGVLKSGDALLCIYEHADSAFEAPAARRRRKVHGINHFGIRIRDREAWLRTIERESVDVNYDGEVRWPHSSAWYVNDPTGYEIEVALWDDDTPKFD